MTEAGSPAQRLVGRGPEIVRLTGLMEVHPLLTVVGTERLMYGWSVTHCLPAALATAPSAGLGTVLREDTVRGLAADAGFGRVDVLPIENDFFRFYRLAV